MKNNFKHIIALLLVLIMSFQMAAFVVADETAEITEEAVEETYVPQNENLFKILNSLDIVTMYDTSDYTGNGVLTRAEAASIAMRMLGLNYDYSMEGKSMPFDDVDTDDLFAYEIYHANNLGIMTGYANKFRPDDTITEEQFVKVIVEVLGYGAEAQSLGGYPHGYTITAGAHHILDDVNYKGAVPLTQDVAVQIVYNAINVEMPDFVMMENGGFMTSVSNTVMAQYLNVTKAYGIMNRNPKTHILTNNASKEGIVQIGDVFYFVGDSNCEDYLGYNVEFYYRKTAEDQLGTILYAEPKSNEVLHLDAKDIINYRNNEYIYEVNGTERRAKAPATVSVIYNGAAAKSGFKDYKPEIGYVELIDNDEDGVADVLSIVSYKIYYIKANNVSQEILVSEDGKQVKYLDAYWNVKNAEGEKLAPKDVVKNTLLLLAVNEDGDIISGFQVDDQVEGKVESLYTAGTNKYVTIFGAEYKASSYCSSAIGSTVKVGNEVGYYVYGDLLLVKCLPESSLTESVGYLIEVGQTGGLENTVMLRMLLQTGEVKIVNVSEKAKLVCYGKTDAKPEDFAKNLQYASKLYTADGNNPEVLSGTETTVRQPVVYKLNAEGEIIYLEIAPTQNPADEVDILSDTDGMQLVYTKQNLYTRLALGVRNVADDSVLLDKTSYFINVPEDWENFDNYRIYPIADLASTIKDRAYDTRVNPLKVYRTGNDIMGGNIMVGVNIVESSSGTKRIVVDKIGEGITDDGVECYMIQGKASDMSNVTIKTSDKSVVDSLTSPSVSEGDYLICYSNSYGLTDKIVVAFDRETATVYDKDGEYTMDTAFNCGGQIYAKNDDIIAYYTGGVIPADGVVAKDTIKYLDSSRFNIVIFDPTLTRADSYLVPASVADIIAFKDNPSQVSTVLATRFSGNGGLLVIYK